MSYHAYHFSVVQDQRDLLLALLSALPFESFEEPDSGLVAYLPPGAGRSTIESELALLADRLAFQYSVEEVPDRNWNEVWEANFQPIRIGDFCGVRAGVHPPMEGVRHEIVIDPEMAFGTGHHATTCLMMEAMAGIGMKGRKVLDYGCGTGILAILADQLGAARVDAVDIEAAAYDNTLHNAERNGAAAVRAWHGSLEVLPDTVYEVILANINRNVILPSLPALFNRLSDTGILLISGILTGDVPTVLEAAEEQKWRILERQDKGEWSRLSLRKQAS